MLVFSNQDIEITILRSKCVLKSSSGHRPKHIFELLVNMNLFIILLN